MKKYDVLIDLDRLKDLHTGLGQTALLFGTEISKCEENRIQFTFLVPKQFNGYFGSHIKYENVSLVRRYFPSLCPRYDVWHSVHQDASYFPSDAKTPLILTIHDLNFLFEKSPKKANIRLKRLQKKVDRANELFVISDFTKQTVQNNLSLSDKIPIVIRNGVEVTSFPSPNRPDYVPSGKILFSIGVVQEKKNQKTLLEMFQFLPENYVLVIAGNKNGGYADELQNAIKAARLGHRVVMPGTVSDEDKFWLLTHCEALLFPSKFEGFGIPPIEAMRLGKPVFASTLSSIPEVCGEHAFYWEHFEPRYMANILLEGLKRFEGDTERVERAINHSLQFSWSTNAQCYIKIYKRLLGI
jgi:glycosyltransferase involved in cell wall biosynthesis